VPTDAVEADDARHFVLSPGNSLTLVIAEGSRADRDASLYLRRALETSDEGRFRVRVRRGDGVRPVDLDGTDVLVLNDARVGDGSAELVRDFVEGGGGVLVVLGAAATWPTSGADLLPGSLGPVEDREEGRGGRLGFLEYGHPVFEAFAGPRSGDFSGARFFRARGLTPTDSAIVTARFDDGSVAMAEATRGRGTVIAWTSTLDVYWNDLALQPVFLPFVHRVAEYLSGRAEPFQWFTTGQVVDLASPDALETAGLALPLASGDGGGFLTLEERGFYVVRPPGTDPERPFVMAVNVNLTESSRADLDPQELLSQITAPAAETATGPEFEALELRREDQERRQSLWRYLLIGAFGLFLLETALSNWVSRRGSGTRSVAIG
jgi:hypothetical protein